MVRRPATFPKLLSLRVANGKPAPRTMRIPAGLVDATGKIDEARLATLPTGQQQRLRDLARSNFS
ncbi:hypothetical protein [Microbacterium sp. zg.Y909]|uniref:hypothetical protein n=1 Tax=Microbacterium sp. zg.Y909 TaxID=2969413 RepID=UPI00214CC8E7|nr:hypothetical protein [Microbacterium sp. zg.Y909]MCR2824946.1 hypothetical protein [Microbacterium sp. zg.Y909]